MAHDFKLNDPGPISPAPAPGALWLVRHAEVEESYHRIFGGRIDMNLSARGREQAEALARFLHGRKFDAFYASPMKRVRQTIAPLANNGFPRPIVDSALREVDFGDWTGLVWEQVQEKFGVSPYTWLEQIEAGLLPNGESARDLRARLEPCLRLILDRHPGQNVLIACHGGVVRVLLALMLGWPLPQFGSVEIDYASVTRVAYVRGKPQVHLLNFTPWKDLK
jgi:broad specificity phosphatase PhoE